MEQRFEEVWLAVTVLDDALQGGLPTRHMKAKIFLDKAIGKLVFAEKCYIDINDAVALKALNGADSWLVAGFREFVLALKEENDATK